MERIGIIGYGRFGQTLAQLLQQDFAVSVFDVNQINLPKPLQAVSLEELACLETIFLAVPIRAFADIVQQLAPLLTARHSVIDVCSVKVYPVQIMQQYLPSNVDIIATHPLFGPDSVQQESLKWVLHSVRDQYQRFDAWQTYFKKRCWQTISMTPEEHDQYAARTQAITHFIGRSLKASGAAASPIDTLGYQKLLQVMEQTCHDSVDLFHDLIQYNPYAKVALEEFLQVAEDLVKKSF